jgi:hypothetical protein
VCKITVFQRKAGILCRVFIFFGGNWTADAGLHGEETSVRAFKGILLPGMKKKM